MLNIPVFNSSKHPVDFTTPPFLRAVAVIKVLETDLFVAYTRNDKLFRFPGGHQEKDETAIQTAIRETKEEIGLTGLNFITKIGSCHIFYDYKNSLSHLIANYFLFEIQEKDWKNKSKPEKGVYPTLENKQKIQENSWEQNRWLFKKLTDITIK